MPSVTVTHVSGTKYKQEITNGKHKVVADVSVSVGGNDSGLDPKEIALGGLGACTAMTILSRAAKKKWDIKSIVVKVTASRKSDPNDAKKKIEVVDEEIEVTGNLSQQELDDIKAVAEECPVYGLLVNDKQFSTKVVKK